MFLWVQGSLIYSPSNLVVWYDPITLVFISWPSAFIQHHSTSYSEFPICCFLCLKDFPTCVCVCVCVLTQSCLTLCDPIGCSSSGLGQNTGAGCYFLLQGILLTQRLNPSLASPALTGKSFTTVNYYILQCLDEISPHEQDLPLSSPLEHSCFSFYLELSEYLVCIIVFVFFLCIICLSHFNERS